MKKAIIVIISIVLFAISLTACGKDTYTRRNDTKFDEWISPDGVHYWYRDGLNGYSYFAVRYDHDGNLVIDEVEK